MFGECCYNVGDVKITMGTGTFMDINTGSTPHTSVNGKSKKGAQCAVSSCQVCDKHMWVFSVGLYPLVGWKLGPEVVYLAEGNAADTGTAIKWAQALGE